jgi:hypothetical protein
VLFSVSHAPASTTHRLTSAIAAAAREGSSSADDRSHVFVKHSLADDVVHDDYMSSPSHGQYTIYLLNPSSPGGWVGRGAGRAGPTPHAQAEPPRRLAGWRAGSGRPWRARTLPQAAAGGW